MAVIILGTLVLGCDTKKRVPHIPETNPKKESKNHKLKKPEGIDPEHARILESDEAFQADDVLTEIDCPKKVLEGTLDIDLDKYRVGCGIVKVPSRHNAPNGSFHKLTYLHITAKDRAKKPLLVIEQGGPGGSSMLLATAYIKFQTKLIDHFDILALEQRGTMWTSSHAECYEYIDYQLNEMAKASTVEDDEKNLDIQVLKQCFERFKAKTDPTTVSTFEIANDIPYTTELLGYDLFSFYGVSYGTTVGQSLLKFHASNLNRVVLDAPTAPGENPNLDYYKAVDSLFSKNIKHALDSWGDNFNLDYGETIDFLKENILKYETKPITVEYKYLGKSYPVRIDGDELIGILIDASVIHYSPDLFATFVNAMNPATENSAVVEKLEKLLHTLTSLDLVTELMNNIINCREQKMNFESLTLENDFPELFKIVPSNLVSQYNRSFTRAVHTDTNWCVMDFEKAPAEELVLSPVHTDVPTLVVTGDNDHITPPKNVDLLSVHFTQVQKHVFANLGHGVFTEHICASESILAYLLSSDASFTNLCQ